MTITVGSFFGHTYNYPTLEKHPLVLGTNLVGIEIELENIRGHFQNRYWEQKEDGSLRNSGQEFVCRGAWGGRDLYNAVIAMDTYLNEQEPDASWRCSTHVHLDVRDLNVKQLKNLILLYTIFEKLLFQMSGMSRYKNNFCPAFGYAQSQITTVARFWGIEGDRFFNRIAGQWVKYSSMNLVPLQRFGSVEFRIAEATYKKGNLLRLCNRYLALKEKAVEWGDRPFEELIEWAASADPHTVFKRGLPKKVDNYGECIETGVKLAWDVISLGTSQLEEEEEVPVPRAAGARFTPPPAPSGMVLSVFPADHEGQVENSFLFRDPRNAWAPILSLLRTRHGWTIPQSARNTSVPLVLEYSYVKPICDALGITLEYFFGDEGRATYERWLLEQQRNRIRNESIIIFDEAPHLIDEDGDDYEDDEDDSEW